MTPDLSPVRLLLVTLAGWINRQQQEVIEYLVEENRVLIEQLRGRRVRLTDDQRPRPAARGPRPRPRAPGQGATLVAPRPDNPSARRALPRTGALGPKPPGPPRV